MGLSDDVDELEDVDEPAKPLRVNLNGMLLSEIATFKPEVSVEFLGEQDRPYFATVTAHVELSTEGDTVDVVMTEENAERAAYQLLAAVERAREQGERGPQGGEASGTE